MTHFYREWLEGNSKSIAVRSAMLAIRAEYPNPFHWAPFLVNRKSLTVVRFSELFSFFL